MLFESGQRVLPSFLIFAVLSFAFIYLLDARRSYQWSQLSRELHSDERIQATLVTLLGRFAVDTTSHIAKTFTSPSFHSLSADIEARMEKANTIPLRANSDATLVRRQDNPLGALGGLFGGITGGNASILGGLGDLLAGGLGGIEDGLLNSLQGPALFLGAGFGSGAAEGLNMSTPEQSKAIVAKVAAANQQTTDGANGIALNLGTGLASAVVPAVAEKVMSPDVMKDLLVTLEAAGAGIGQGAAEGLGAIKQIAPGSALGGGADATGFPEAAMLLTKGMTSSFLQSVNFTALATKMANIGGSGDSDRTPIATSKIAEGFARGLVDGAVSGAYTAGGIENIIRGNVSTQTLNKAATQVIGSTFDDSVNGASVAFGRGLANEGIVIIGAVMNQRKSPAENRAVLQYVKRSTDLALRQALPPANKPVINSTLLSFAAQQGVNALQCDGLGGLVAIALGLWESKTIDVRGAGFKIQDETASLLPQEPSRIELEGNVLEFKIQDIFSSRLNGLGMVQFAALLIFHILFALIAFFFVLPGFLIMKSIQRISSMLGKPVDAAKSEKWQYRLVVFVFFPLMLTSTVLGIAGMGNSRQLRTPHGIVGFIAAIVSIPAVIVYHFRSRDPRLFPTTTIFPLRRCVFHPPKLNLPIVNALLLAAVYGLSHLSFTTGFDDLRSFTFCFSQAVLRLPIVVGFGTGALAKSTAAAVLVILRVWLEKRKPVEGEVMDVESEGKPQPLAASKFISWDEQEVDKRGFIERMKERLPRRMNRGYGPYG